MRFAVRRRAGLRAVALAPVLRLAVVFRFAVVLRLAVVFRFAVVLRLAVVFLAGDFRFAVFFFAVDFFRAGTVSPPPSWSFEGSVGEEVQH